MVKELDATKKNRIIDYKIYFWMTIITPVLCMITGLIGIYLYGLDIINSNLIFEEMIINLINRSFALMGVALLYVASSIGLTMILNMRGEK